MITPKLNTIEEQSPEPQVLEILYAQDWDDIIPKLAEYTIMKVKNLSWYTGHKDLPGGLTIEDVVFKAIGSLFNGTRKWEPAEKPDILIHLKSIIKSMINHLVESSDHKKTAFSNPVDESKQSIVELLVSKDRNPEELLISKEKSREIEKMIWNCAGDDEEIGLVLLCLEEISKPSMIAQELGWEVNKVYSVLRKYRRRLESWERQNK